MRLFVAVVPPDEVLRDLDRFVGPLRDEQPALRWVPPVRWHLTLAFLGSVAEDVLPDLRARLGRAAARSDAPVLAFAGGGRFDGRVLWAGVHGDRPALRRLSERCAGAARRTGIAVEERAYRPHLTLASSPEPADLRALAERLAGYTGPSWRADAVMLMRSYLGPAPRYEPVKEWALRGAD